MLQKINLEVDHETILNEITDLNLKWFGWNFKNYAKDKTITSIDWGKSSPIGVFSLRFSKHQDTILKAIPQLKDIKFDPKNRSNTIDAAIEINFIFLDLKFINTNYIKKYATSKDSVKYSDHQTNNYNWN